MNRGLSVSAVGYKIAFRFNSPATGDAHAERPQSHARSLYTPPLVSRHGPLPAGSLLFTPNARPRRLLVSALGPSRSPGCAFAWGDSDTANPLAPPSLRKFLAPTILAWERWWPSPTLVSGGPIA